MNEITVTGMVLTSVPHKEYDRRLTLLTKERGKISVFANGVRRSNNVLSGAVNPFSFGSFTMHEGRSSYSLISAEISNYFEGFRENLEAAYYGYYFLEFASYYGKEACDETLLLKLLYQSLRALLNDKLPNRLVRYIYELKIVTINGEGPQVFECLSCGDREREKLFSIRRGGLLCKSCAAHISDGRKLMPSTLYALQYIVASPIEKLYTFLLTEEVEKELGLTVSAYLEEYVGKKFSSLAILETILG